MLTSDQIRAARALIRWTAQRLADESGLSWKTVQRLEATEGVPSVNARTLVKIQETLANAGVEFIDENGGGPGVRLKNRMSSPGSGSSGPVS